MTSAMFADMQSEPIIAAAIAGTFAFAGVVWQSRKTRRINTREHDVNASKLDRIEGTVERVAGKVEKVSGKVDRLAEQQMRHESVKHRGKRLW